jgi:hypothetical protein
MDEFDVVSIVPVEPLSVQIEQRVHRASGLRVVTCPLPGLSLVLGGSGARVPQV